MRILQLHSNFIVFKPVEKEIASAEEAEKKENRIEEVVVLFTAVEEGDNSQLAIKAIDDVRAFLAKQKKAITRQWRRKPSMTLELFLENSKLTAF